ncbi:2-phosphosulfolactate phosphatase [Christensenella timonensis]|uniref:2-phosphosulfolactate phosphatase n=1 Tax=Christensenella timonensis TaxID=1816678 RepID=UPI00082C4B8D|nr:2-phosphosulfolactate phosphatase [Christensenella timonensis]
MKIICSAVFSDLPRQELQDRTAVMIDALRASATIITAISNKCDRIVPTEEANEAAAIKKISEGNVLLCGEIAAQKVSGFDLGNSPLEFTEDVVAEKIIIFSTTNGTVAIKSMAAAEDVLIGSFINAEAVAKKARSLENDIVLVCAGTKGKFSTDDMLAMGCIIDRLLRIDETLETDDMGKVALKLYHDANHDILSALEGSTHFEYLKQLKLYDDLEYCTREDTLGVVPVYQEGVIIKG